MQSRKRIPGNRNAADATLTMIVVAIAQSVAGAALATEGCPAVNAGALNADVSANTPVARQVALGQGDQLSFAAYGASVALVSGPGAPAALIGGTSAISA